MKRTDYSRNKLLLGAELDKVVAQAQQGNAQAQNILLASATRMIWSYVIKRYHSLDEHFKEDLVQVGLQEVYLALKTYDKSKGASIFTHAFYKIKTRIRDYVYSYVPIVKRITTKEHMKAIQAVLNNREKGSHYISKETGHKESDIVRVRSQWNDVSFDDVDVAIKELSSNPISDFEMLLDNNIKKKSISEAISNALSDREKFIINMRFGDNPMTRKSIGEQLNVSQQRIDELEKRALKKIKEYINVPLAA